MTLHAIDDALASRLQAIARQGVQHEMEKGPMFASEWLYEEAKKLGDPECVRSRLIELVNEYRKKAGVA